MVGSSRPLINAERGLVLGLCSRQTHWAGRCPQWSDSGPVAVDFREGESSFWRHYDFDMTSRHPPAVLPHALHIPGINKLAGKRVILASNSPRRKEILQVFVRCTPMELFS
jgi:hypothetical protein